jgi:hypothetical protein
MGTRLALTGSMPGGSTPARRPESFKVGVIN